MSKISFVYFDLGGVLVRDLTSEDAAWQRMKRDIGIPPELDSQFDKAYDAAEYEAQAGKDIDDFISIFTKKFGIKFPENYSFITDFVSRFNQNESIWNIYSKAQVKWPTGILTNMYPRLFDAIDEAGLLPPGNLGTVVDSSVVHAQRPEREIYDVAQVSAGVPAGEILFIDDRPDNLVEPAKLGWQTFRYDPLDLEASNQKLSQYLGL